jgi:hypothetical protein
MSPKRRYCAGVLAILIVAVLTVRAEDFWVKKPWTQWSKDECNRIMEDSPWTKKWSKGEVNLTAAMPGVSGAASEGAGGEKTPEIHYFVQLRSSLPIREAVVRQQQIQQHYDKMTDAQKKEFDSSAQEFISRTYPDVIFVHVDYGSNIQTFERQMAVYFKSIRPESVPVDFYLINERGERESPAKFVSPPNGSYAFEMLFPRLKASEPFVHDGDKSLSIQFINPAVGTQSANGGDPVTTLDPSLTPFNRERVLIQFKLDKMMVNGKLSY